MQQAYACEAAGDAAGALAAYRQADELGDASAAILLGNLLRGSGDFDQAKAAFLRAEGRGHPEAAMSLGNLFDELGDVDAAKAAYLRSIELGSLYASLNLGLMLARLGEDAEALPHLERAAESGEVGGFWGVGKVHEKREEWQAAADSYRRGVDLNDAECAFGLGLALYQLGDLRGSKTAFEQALELGHDGAASVLEALERELTAPPTPAGPDIGELWRDVTAVIGALASERQRLGRRWIADTMEVRERQSRAAALKNAYEGMSSRFNSVCATYKIPEQEVRDQEIATVFAGGDLVRIPGTEVDDWLDATPGQSEPWQLASRQARAFSSDLDKAADSLRQAATKRLGGGLRRKGLERLSRVQQRLDVLAQTTQAGEESVRDAERTRAGAAQTAAEQSRRDLEDIASLGSSAALLLPPILQPWSSPSWDAWSTDDRSSVGIRLAYVGSLVPKPDPQLGPNADFGTDLRIPWAFALHENLLLQHDGPSRASAHALVRSIMVRHLVAVEPGEVKFCIFDPVGLGQSAGVLLDLAEYEADLIGGKVWTGTQDLESRLKELSDHIELVIQKYLRTTYETIDEYNDAAGEVAEPYRVLVLFDFPTGLTSESTARLKSVLENGPRCGVFTTIVSETGAQAPYGVDVAQLSSAVRRMNLQADFADDINGYKLETAFDYDGLPDGSEAAKRVIDRVGRACIERSEAAITFDRVFTLYADVAARGLRPELGRAATQTRSNDPATWWTGDSTRGLFAPIGQKGARDVAILGFDSSDRAGALLVGRPGSGKSTLLHTYIGGLTSLYGPDELDLYLIDFKEGVEFKAYAEQQLPHAKVIAIESDREFGLSVLESLQAEITQRAELLRATGGRQAGLQALREATAEKLPRILLVFDEFQVLFARNDKVGIAAADLLESIIRQGRGFGVHVLLGSQSLAGLDALGAHVPQLLPVRILLPAADSDARKVLGDNNNAGDYLTGHGEGILNNAGGAVESNERFKGALLTEEDRVIRLQTLRHKANEAGFTRVPVVFEGNSLVVLDTEDPERFREELAATGKHPVRLRTGAPMTVGDIGDIALSREAGANVLAIVRAGDTDTTGIEPAGGIAYGLLSAAVASASMTGAAIDVIDFMSTDDGLDSLLEPLLNAGRITLKRRRAFADVLSEYRAEVDDRVDEDDSARPGRLLFLFGIHRARDLDSDVSSLDVDEDLVENMERVMRDGPEVGVHVWLWSDSVSAVSRRLTPRMTREVEWRIAGRMSADDSHQFIGTGQAADLRDSQLLMINEDRGVSTRVTGYAPPTTDWVAQLAAGTLTE